MTQPASFECTIEGRGDFDDIQPDIKSVRSSLRHSALSNTEITTVDLGDQAREYANFFAPFELRVKLYNGDGEPVDSQRVFKGILTEIESQGQASEMTLKTEGRGWHLDNDESIVEFENIRVWEAIEKYLNEETDFEVEVIPDPGSPVLTDAVSFSASSQEDWEVLIGDTIPDDKPITVDEGRLTTLPTAFVAEGEDSTDITASDDKYSGGEAGRIEDIASPDIRLDFNLEHKIPAGEGRIHIRGENLEDDLNVIVEVFFDGEPLTDTSFGSFGYRDFTVSEEITAGSHTVSVEHFSGSGEGQAVDIIAFEDSRFDHTFDDEVHEPGGYLNGPETHPDEVSFEFPIDDRETQVATARIESTWDDTAGAQALAASNNAGQDYLSATNTESLEADFSAAQLVGTELRVKTTHGRHSPNGPRNQTPRLGYAGQSVDEIEVRFDQTSIAVIGSEGLLLSESDLDNVKTLCELARFNFAIDHTADGKRIEAFPIGTQGGDVDWETEDWDRRDGDADYANRVVARGARKPEEEQEDENDLRYEAVAVDDDEIERLMALGLTEAEATISTVITDPELQTQEEVAQQAFNNLEGFVGSRLPSGTVEVVPTFIPPGYAYPISEFEHDGETPIKTLEKLNYSEGYNSARGSLQFEPVRNWVNAVTPIDKDVSGIKRLF